MVAAIRLRPRFSFVRVLLPDEFSALLQSESARYAKVVREAGIKAD